MKFQFHSKIGLPKTFFQTKWANFFKEIKNIFNEMVQEKKKKYIYIYIYIYIIFKLTKP